MIYEEVDEATLDDDSQKRHATLQSQKSDDVPQPEGISALPSETGTLEVIEEAESDRISVEDSLSKEGVLFQEGNRISVEDSVSMDGVQLREGDHEDQKEVTSQADFALDTTTNLNLQLFYFSKLLVKI